ncbi:hypothetical protein [Polaribacter uvawellassae]|uniref:hypothetical protein n=1 Tax=Polaribacter uvawellassae TaxID=3133495 RepID=UPI00321903DB
MQKWCFLVFFLFSIISFSQEKDSLYFKNGIENPSLLTTHHFGIFSARINQNFKRTAAKKTTFTFSSESGNTFHPFVEMYIPKDPAIRENFSNTIWYDRQFTFINQATTPAEYSNIIIDAVIRGFRLQVAFPIAKEHELGITLRSYLITKGNDPFSLITSDESIEWFHSNIAGGEDPYGRRYYGLNQVHFKYTDRNGKILELKNNDFFLGGIEFNHHYYPKFLINKKQNLFVNFGSHLGVNTSKFNSSIDVGFSANLIHKIQLQNKNEFNIAIGGSVLRKNLINFKDAIDLGNNKFLGSVESEIEFTKFTRKKNYHSFGIHYQIQTRYNKHKEASYYHLKGKWREIKAGWQHGFTTLYEGLSAWTFLYSYRRPNYKITLYLKEDLLVNNAPDAQTGISIQIPISN